MGQGTQHLVGNKVLAQSLEAKTKAKTPGSFLEPLLSFLSLGMLGSNPRPHTCRASTITELHPQALNVFWNFSFFPSFAVVVLRRGLPLAQPCPELQV